MSPQSIPGPAIQLPAASQEPADLFPVSSHAILVFLGSAQPGPASIMTEIKTVSSVIIIISLRSTTVLDNFFVHILYPLARQKTVCL